MDQLVEIIKVLGTPTKEQIREMNSKYIEFDFPQIKAYPWQRVSSDRIEKNDLHQECMKDLIMEICS